MPTFGEWERTVLEHAYDDVDYISAHAYYEEEGDLFFEDRSAKVLQDDVFARLLTFPNVLITGHQAFFTEEALWAIATTTIANITAIENGEPCPNTIGPDVRQG